MSDEKKNAKEVTKNHKELFSLISSHIKNSKDISWEGTLEDYINIVIKNPSLNMNAHSRILRMIESTPFSCNFSCTSSIVKSLQNQLGSSYGKTSN